MGDTTERDACKIFISIILIVVSMGFFLSKTTILTVFFGLFFLFIAFGIFFFDQDDWKTFKNLLKKKKEKESKKNI